MRSWFVGQAEQILSFIQAHGWTILRNVLIVAVVLLFTGPLAKRVDHAVRRVFTRMKKDEGLADRRAATLGTLVGSVVRYALWGVGIAICLAALGLSSQAGALIAAAGISGGVVIGFGAQKLLQDFFAGIVFFADHPFMVGDVVSIGGLSGTVESLKLRTTVIRAASGEKHILPNGSIGAITNLSANHSLAVCEIFLPSIRSLSALEPVLLSAALQATEGDEDVVEPPSVLGITAFTDRGMMAVRTTCRTKPLKNWGIERKLRAAQLDALIAAGIVGSADANGSNEP